MRYPSTRIARTLLVALCLASLAVPAAAQAPAAQQPPPTQPPPAIAQVPASKASEPTGPTTPLSLESAIKMALENNLSVRVERINPQIQDQTIEQAKTAWTPNLTGTIKDSHSASPVTSVLAGASGQLTQESLQGNVGANQLLPWGANYTVLWDASRGKSNSIYASPNPSLGSDLNFNFTQPLIRNRAIDNAREQ